MKKLYALLVSMLLAVGAYAAVDVNKATQAELESVKGIGPAMSTKILDERKKGDFKDWSDLITRVSGVGEGNAAKFSTGGLTVGGASYKAAAAAPAASAAKPAASSAKPAKASASKPAAASAAAKPAASGAKK